MIAYLNNSTINYIAHFELGIVKTIFYLLLWSSLEIIYWRRHVRRKQLVVPFREMHIVRFSDQLYLYVIQSLCLIAHSHKRY